MYRIINRKYINSPTGSPLMGSVCDIVCDNFDDIPTDEDISREAMLSGSWLWISNERTFLTLNAQGGYIPLHVEPTDWETNWSDYFNKIDNSYVQLTGTEAPEWKPNTYYRYTTSPAFV